MHALWHSDVTVACTDEQLLRQFLTGTRETAEAAFAIVVERYGPIVHRVCLDVLDSSHEAQDAAQAVFLVLAKRASSIRKPGSLGPWLHGAAVRVARRAQGEAARRRAAERKKAQLTRELHLAQAGRGDMDYTELHAEIDGLPEKYRQPIVLCHLQGQTQMETAQTLGWPLGTVQVRLHRGRELLRARLTRRGAGMIALKACDPAPSPWLNPGVITREWIETTASAGVRFAAGKGTAGLVAPAVSGLAESVLAAMLGDSLKLMVLVPSVLVLGFACLYLATRLPTSNDRAGSAAKAVPATAPTRQSGPAPARAIPQARGGPLPRPDQSSRVAVTSENPRPAVPPKQSIGPQAAAVAPSTLDQGHADAGSFPPKVSGHRSPSSAMAGPRSQTKPNEGRELFERTWVKNDPRGHGGDGLGPVFNGQSCVGCHHLGGTGGAGASVNNVDIITPSGTPGEGTGYSYSFSMDFGAGRFEYHLGDDVAPASRRETPADSTVLAAIHPGFREARSLVLHRYGTDTAYNAWRESVLGRRGSIMIQVSQRSAPALFGAGLIDAIPDAAIVAAARRKLTGSPQVKGRLSRLKDGRIGRFGWKAQVATLDDFVVTAAAGEIGLEVPGRHQAADPRLPGIAAPGLDMDERECAALVAYVRGPASPLAVNAADGQGSTQVKAGEATFKSIGCTACHMPKLGEVEGIYSDLLLHDMGGQLGDADTYSVFVGEPPRADRAVATDRMAGAATATVREWRTPPLWGIRDSAPYLHDGRAATIAQAITLHAGQGATAARRYAELSPRRKQQLEAFLLSLAAPGADR
jgi:RNA polymerase sigma factor (sigma-70 family)